MSSPAPVILVCGSRGFRNPALVAEVVDAFALETMVITGGAMGPDKRAALAARLRGLHVAVVSPLWDFYGRAAGVKRNAAMLRLGPSHVVAFWDGTSPGTRSMIDLARAAGVPVTIYAEDGSSRLLAE